MVRREVACFVGTAPLTWNAKSGNEQWVVSYQDKQSIGQKSGTGRPFHLNVFYIFPYIPIELDQGYETT